MSLEDQNIKIITKPSSVNLNINESTGDIDISTIPQIIKVQVGAILQTSSGSFVVGETPLGLINGSNAIFSTSQNFVPESIQVFINGISQTNSIDYTTSGTNTINMNVSPIVGDYIRVNYKIG
jgi:hypothetical protein